MHKRSMRLLQLVLPDWGYSVPSRYSLCCDAIAHLAGDHGIHHTRKLRGDCDPDACGSGRHDPLCQQPQLGGVKVRALGSLTDEVLKPAPAELTILSDGGAQQEHS